MSVNPKKVRKNPGNKLVAQQTHCFLGLTQKIKVQKPLWVYWRGQLHPWYLVGMGCLVLFFSTVPPKHILME